MRHRKYICFLAVLLAVTGTFSGCGKEPDKNQAITPEPTVEQKADTEEQGGMPDQESNETKDSEQKQEDVTEPEEKQQGQEDTTEQNPVSTTPVLEESLKIDEQMEDVDLSDYFGKKNACAVLYDTNTGKCYVYNKDMIYEEHSPCSTFKIVAALAGIKYGVVTSLDDKMGYSGKEYSNQSWNSDLTLQDAYEQSCVWYFRKLIDRVGQDHIQQVVDDVHYGNCDITHWGGEREEEYPDLSGFWLESSLKISPVEQVQMLYDIFKEDSAYKEQLYLLKPLMLVKENDYGSIYGKTGTGNNTDRVCVDAWFTGFNIREDRTVYIAIRMDGFGKDSKVSGPIAKEIACELLSEKTLAYMK